MAPSGTWQFVTRAPDHRLAGAVLDYTGYSEHFDGPVRRLQVPTTVVPLILTLGPGIAINGVGHGSFVAGLDDTVVVTEHTGHQLGVQINLTPLGARRLIGLPMGELARRVVGVEEVMGNDGRRLIDALREATSWARRFTLLDRALMARLATAPPVAPEVQHAWRRLRDAHGAVPIATLARETGRSRRHLTARFGEEVGMPPKAVARILRFERVTALIQAGGGKAGSLADAAYACGYSDQAHLNRDFRAFAGTTPTDFAARLMSTAAGVSGEGFPNVQDELARAA